MYRCYPLLLLMSDIVRYWCDISSALGLHSLQSGRTDMLLYQFKRKVHELTLVLEI